jgi:hypothetical protein
MTVVMEALNDLAGELDIAILLIHHHRKSSGKEQDSGTGLDKARGAGAIGANCPISISGKRDRFVFDTKFRKPEDFAVSVEGSTNPDGTKTLQVVFHNPDESTEARQNQVRVLEAIKKLRLFPAHVTNKALEEELKISANTLKDRLKPLLDAGLVESFRIEHGAFAYKLAGLPSSIDAGYQNGTLDEH